MNFRSFSCYFILNFCLMIYYFIWKIFLKLYINYLSLNVKVDHDELVNVMNLKINVVIARPMMLFYYDQVKNILIKSICKGEIFFMVLVGYVYYVNFEKFFIYLLFTYTTAWCMLTFLRQSSRFSIHLSIEKIV